MDSDGLCGTQSIGMGSYVRVVDEAKWVQN